MSFPRVVEEAQPANALTLLDGMNVDRVKQVLNTIHNFQQVVQATLREGHDYGKIPGAGDKPTLLKPGAEKILMIMGATSEYEITEKVQDYETGFFAYTVRCRLSRNGITITEGVGNCNSRERKYTGDKQDKYVLANTCLKMAKKRAQVDAALTIGSLSDLFTQDIEDMAIDRQMSSGGTNQGQSRRPASNSSQSNGQKATEKQLMFLDQKAGEKGITPDLLDDYCVSVVGKKMDELTKKDASAIIDSLKNYNPPVREEAASVERDDPFADNGKSVDIADEDLPF